MNKMKNPVFTLEGKGPKFGGNVMVMDKSGQWVESHKCADEDKKPFFSQAIAVLAAHTNPLAGARYSAVPLSFTA